LNAPRETFPASIGWRMRRARPIRRCLIYENLQLGCKYLSTLPGNHQPVRAGAAATRLFAQIDGVVSSRNATGQVIFPLLLWRLQSGVSDARPGGEHSTRILQGAVRATLRARVPGLIYYLNGDLRCVQRRCDATVE